MKFTKPLSVEELINELQKYPKDAQVWFYNDDDRYFLDHGNICVLDEKNIGISSFPFSEENFWRK